MNQSPRHQNSTPFWEAEKPITAASKFVELAYYPGHGKLQIVKRTQDRATGEERTRTLTLDRRDLQSQDMATLWRRFLDEAKGSDLP